MVFVTAPAIVVCSAASHDRKTPEQAHFGSALGCPSAKGNALVCLSPFVA